MITAESAAEKEFGLDQLPPEMRSDSLKKMTKEIVSLRESLSKFQIHGTDGCQNCDTGRITIFSKHPWCFDCRFKKEHQ